MKKVLIVDDEATNFDYFVERCVADVQVSFCKLQNVESFDEATALIEAETPDIVLLDANYGTAELGPSLAFWLMKHHPDIQIIGNSSCPSIWKAVPGLRFSREKCGDEIIEILRRMCSVQVTKPVQKQIPSKVSELSVTTECLKKGTRWEKIAIVRDSITGQYHLLFTFDEPEEAQRKLYEEDIDGRECLVAFLQLSFPEPVADAYAQRAAREHLTKLMNDEWTFAQDCVAILEQVLHSVFMAGLRHGYEIRLTQERDSACRK